jgi:hypothetical protein
MEEFNNGNLSIEAFGEEVEGEAESALKEAFLDFLGEGFVMQAKEKGLFYEVLI